MRFPGLVIDKKLHHVSARGKSAISFEQLIFRVQPRAFVPDKRRFDRELLVKEERLKIINMELDHGGTQSRFMVLLVR